MPTRTFSSSIDINSDPMTVWTVLTDLARYPEWHPRIWYAAGTMTPGSTYTTRARTPEGRSVTHKNKVITAKPGSELRTRGRVPGLSRNERFTHLTPSNGGTHLAQSETVRGPVPWLLAGRLDAVAARTLAERDQALKARAEAIHRTGHDPDLPDRSPVGPPSYSIGASTPARLSRSGLPALPRVAGLALLGLYFLLGYLYFPSKVLLLSLPVVAGLIALRVIWSIVIIRSRRARGLPPSRRG